MSITTSCPGCKAMFRLPDDLAGKPVRCQKCARLFEVPLLVTGAPPPAPVEAVPASPPNAEAPPPVEEAPQPAAEVASALLAAPKPVTTTPVPRERPASVAWSLLALGFFLLSALGAGGVSVLWVYTHLAPPIRSTFVSGPVIGNDRRFKDGKDRVIDKVFKIEPNNFGNAAPTPTPIIFGPDGKANLNGRIEHPARGIDHGRFANVGPYHVYRIPLMQGKMYNFYVSGFGVFTPGLEIYDGDVLVANRSGAAPNRLLLGFRPNHTAAYLLVVTSQQRVPGNFFLNIAPEQRPPARQVDLVAQPNFVDGNALRVEDPLQPMPEMPDDGPYRDYEVMLEVDKDYTFRLASATFAPKLHIQGGIGHARVGGKVSIDIPYRALFTGKHQVRVTSQQYGLGNYTLTLARKGEFPVTKNLQRIIVPLDEAGRHEEQRALTVTDPPEPGFAGRGPYKVHLVRLEKGETYTIEMTSGVFDTYLGLYDPHEKQVAVNVSKIGARHATIIHQATETGMYRIHAAATQPKRQGGYTLKIAQNPQR